MPPPAASGIAPFPPTDRSIAGMSQTATQAAKPPTAPLPFDEIGGAEPVHALVAHFYDLMDQDPAYAALRGLHAPDLGPMRQSLAGFLIGWLGGPRDWFAANPGTCMMSAHRALDIGPDVAAQWLDAMGRAMDATHVPPDLAARMNAAFVRMASGMQRTP
jgi:hemoglobin